MKMPGTLSILLCVLYFTVDLTAYGEKNDSTFVASREWQPVRKGQPIPSGLHIRHNFQTGLTEAKLLDEEAESDDDDDESDTRTKSLILHPDESLSRSNDEIEKIDNTKNEADRLKISLKELKARLKKIKLTEKTESEAQDRFRSYTILKTELKAIEVNVTSDAEMLATYFQRFENYRDSVTAESLKKPMVDDVLQILNNMEYLLHQIDNAQTFADMEGMAKIISPCFNTTNHEIKSEALRILGTAVQSNPKVQGKALEHDFVQKLLHILVVNKKIIVQSRCLFALSALVRQYPIAQKVLIDHGGFEIFGQILEAGHSQTQSRIMNLMSDLVIERIGLNKIEDEIVRHRKTREYANTNFEDKLLAQNYCKHLCNLMIKSFSNEAFGDSNMEDYEFLGIILDSMITLGVICKRDFRTEKYSLIAVINEALRHYESVRDVSTLDDDHSFGHVALQLGRLKRIIFEELNDEL